MLIQKEDVDVNEEVYEHHSSLLVVGCPYPYLTEACSIRSGSDRANSIRQIPLCSHARPTLLVLLGVPLPMDMSL